MAQVREAQVRERGPAPEQALAWVLAWALALEDLVEVLALAEKGSVSAAALAQVVQGDGSGPGAVS